MAIIVRHKKRDTSFLYLGAGYGEWHSSHPGMRGGLLFPDEMGGESMMVCVCDYAGNVGFFHADEVEVVSIDGKTPKEVLTEAAGTD